MKRKDHWERVYRAKAESELSWFQPHAVVSTRMIREAVPNRGARIVDVGAGASRLVDDLLAADYRHIVVLDVAQAGLLQARRRLGSKAPHVDWLQADALSLPLTAASIALWHDRAVFHFLVDPAERARYVAEVRRTVRPGGLVLVATFAADGPTTCSGLEVSRYDVDGLQAAFGPDFALEASWREVHETPAGVAQPFSYCLCRHGPPARRETAVPGVRRLQRERSTGA
jgi:SAM-dependent methyltransferase